jgi:PAS domain S-box-containing protein
VVIVSLLVMLATHHWAKVERDRSAAFTTERNLLRTVIDHAPDCVYVKDTAGRLVLQNTAVVRLLGARSHEELTGRTVFDLYPSDVAARYQADEQTVMRSGFALANHEESLIDSKGCPRWLLTTRVPLRDSNGQIIGLVGIGRDITERKQAEDSLAWYNQRLDALHALDQSVLAGMSAEEISYKAVQHLADLLPCSYASIALFDPQAGTGRVLIEWCPEGLPRDGAPPSADLTGFPATRDPTPLLERDTAAASDPDPLYAALLARGIHTYFSAPLVAEDLVIGRLNLGATDPDAFGDDHLEIAGEIANQLAIALHHTDLRQQLQQYTSDLEKRVEQRTAEIKRVTDRVEAILNNSSDAIILAYADGTITQTNPTFDRLFGYQPDTLFHQPLASVFHPEHAALFSEILAAVVRDGEVRQIEIVACRADGTTFFSEAERIIATALSAPCAM